MEIAKEDMFINISLAGALLDARFFLLLFVNPYVEVSVSRKWKT